MALIVILLLLCVQNTFGQSSFFSQANYFKYRLGETIDGQRIFYADDSNVKKANHRIVTARLVTDQSFTVIIEDYSCKVSFKANTVVKFSKNGLVSGILSSDTLFPIRDSSCNYVWKADNYVRLTQNGLVQGKSPFDQIPNDDCKLIPEGLFVDLQFFRKVGE